MFLKFLDDFYSILEHSGWLGIFCSTKNLAILLQKTSAIPKIVVVNMRDVMVNSYAGFGRSCAHGKQNLEIYCVDRLAHLVNW